MQSSDMAPLTAWLPAHSDKDFDLVVKIVGPGASTLLKEWSPIAQFLLDRGFAVMAQSGRLNGDFGDGVLRIRIAARTFYSMGDGCDVIVHLGEHVPAFWRFGLQPGSVFLWESPTDPRLYPSLPEGVVPYHVPLSVLCTPYGEGVTGKGFAALGALLQLLGIQEEALPRLTAAAAAPRSFAAGWDYARRVLEKHDAYSLPLFSTADAPCQVLLSPHQAIMTGFAASACECGEACSGELNESAAQWITRHAGMADAIVSVLESDKHPGVQAYRGPQGRMVVLLRGDDAAIASCLNGFEAPRVFVAADILDALKLVIAGSNLLHRGQSEGVGILIEETVARRQQSVDIRSLVDMIRRGGAVGADTAVPYQPDPLAATVDREEGTEADVGFVTWGAAQGVVRDAIALCRNFGLRVAGLYPKIIVPFPKEELESFARTVKRIVLVESNRTHGYEERLRAACSFPASVLTPPLGQALTPMDIFLRESLGAV
jgi:pyruvate:ferredoxin oxidoreductase-like protein